jgi:hypothetical protein
MKFKILAAFSYLALWLIISVVGSLINTTFLSNSVFGKWHLEYLLFPITFSALFITSKKYFISLHVILITILIITNIYSVSFHEYNQYGLLIVQYLGALLFPHNEIILNTTLIQLNEYLSTKWAIFIATTIVIFNTTLNLYIIKYIVRNIWGTIEETDHRSK